MGKMNYNSTPLQPQAPLKSQQTSFYNMPDSPASNLILDVLGAGANVGDLPDRKRQVNHNTEYEVLENENKRLISLKNATGTAEVTIELADIEKLMGSNKPAKKLFVLSLIKANEQAIFNGQLTKDYVSFPLQELVDIGFYKALRSARTGFYTGTDILTDIKIKGKTRKKRLKKKKDTVTIGEEKEATTARPAEAQAEVAQETPEAPEAEAQEEQREAPEACKEEAPAKVKIKVEDEQTEEAEDGEDRKLRVLFTGADIERGQCFIYLNPHINWSFLTQYFTILPTYYFRLSNRASDLLYYIFYLARQHTGEKDIVEVTDETTGKKRQAVVFNISFRAIQHKLMLPNEKGAANPQRDIRDAIEDAIEQIEDEHKKTYNNMEFSLLPVYDLNSSITEYLDNGYLKVELKGDFATTFIAISKDTEKQIAESKKRQARIQEKAIAIATAKKIEKGKKESGAS